MAVQENELLGVWRAESTNPADGDSYGEVTLKFNADGTLLYTIHGREKDEIMRLTYRLEPGIIVTDQPSQPRAEKTEYEVGHDGSLILTFGGRKSRYIKIC